jgi:hypothetical protein
MVTPAKANRARIADRRRFVGRFPIAAAGPTRCGSSAACVADLRGRKMDRKFRSGWYDQAHQPVPGAPNTDGVADLAGHGQAPQQRAGRLSQPPSAV